MDELIERHMGLIISVAKKFYGIAKEDLISSGIIGLMKAYKNYKPELQVKFSTYAREYIFGEMYAQVYAMQPLKVNKELLTLCKKIEQTRYQLALTLGYVPSNIELAEYLGQPLAQIEQAILCVSEVISMDKENDDAKDLEDTLSSKETMSMDERVDLRLGIESLPQSEQQIIDYRYFKDMTQSEVANLLDMTQVMVSRYEKKGLKRLKEYYEVR